jgi:hypothetical protein
MIMPFKKDDRGDAVSSLFWFVFYTNVAPAAVHMAALFHKKFTARSRPPQEPESGGSIRLAPALELPGSQILSEPAPEAQRGDLRCPGPECFNRRIETGVLHLKWG